MKRTDKPTQPRTEYEYTPDEFARLLGIDPDQSVSTVHVSWDKVTVLAYPKRS